MLREDGAPAGDAWRSSRTGVRADWDLTERDALTVLVDAGGGRYGQLATLPTYAPPQMELRSQLRRTTMTNLLARWSHHHRSGAESSLQVYYDWFDRTGGLLAESRATFDLDYQNRLRFAGRHDLMWGLGYRQSADAGPESEFIRLRPNSETLRLYSGFFQDEIELQRGRLWLALGSRLERNHFTGLEIQPTVRLLAEPRPGQSLWAAVSRAVRTPSRGEQDGESWVASIPALPGAGLPPQTLHLVPSPEFGSAAVVAAEGGYRGKLGRRTSLDVALFRNRYRSLRSIDFGRPFYGALPVPHLVVPLRFTNRGRGESAGVEVAARWEVRSGWRLTGTYNRLWKDLRLDPGANPETTLLAEDQRAPAHQFSLRSSWDLPRNLQLDANLYRTGKLPKVVNPPFAYPELPAALRGDLRLAWTPRPELELSVTGQNLLDGRHPEFNPEVWFPQQEIRRGIYGQVRWRF
jgi:iron complex outermembrane receptor protein